jgi:putative ABC transport system substrate-binding protein
VRRRDFIALISGAATWPLAARAQQAAIPVIGLLHSRSRESFMPNLAGFPEALKEAGYIDGQNISVEYRFADGQYEKLPALAAERSAARLPCSSPAAASHPHSQRKRQHRLSRSFLPSAAIR